MDSWFDLTMAIAAAIQAFTALVIMWATIKIRGYTKVTIEEGRKDRRKDAIENKLKEAYSPLYEIMRRAHIDNRVRAVVRQIDPEKKFVFTEEEFTKIWSIVETFGHHLGGQERMALTNTIREDRVELHDFRLHEGIGWHRFEYTIMIEHYNHVYGMCRDLMRELDVLTKA